MELWQKSKRLNTHGLKVTEWVNGAQVKKNWTGLNTDVRMAERKAKTDVKYLTKGSLGGGECLGYLLKKRVNFSQESAVASLVTDEHH